MTDNLLSTKVKDLLRASKITCKGLQASGELLHCGIMSDKEKTLRYKKGDTTVVWQPHLCQHSAVCVKGLPRVFNPKARPWINTEGAEEQAIRDQVMKCPSRALSLE